jgi:hypothetical protein
MRVLEEILDDDDFIPEFNQKNELLLKLYTQLSLIFTIV